MTFVSRILSAGLVGLLLSASGAALAQETSADSEAATNDAATAELSTGTPVDGPGSVYIKSNHGDWDLRCARAEDGSDPCELHQVLKDESGENPVAEITMVALPAAPEGTPEDKKIAAGVTIVAPLESYLPEGVKIAIDGGKAKAYPFVFCTREGCVARIGLLDSEVAAMKKGNAATVTVIPAVAPDKAVNVTMSLKGFTDAFTAVTEANKPAAAE
ncbi:MAG: invasion associated locus B family protein [Paracoccaceae bacterium]